MTNQQLYLAIGVPLLFNTAMLALVVAMLGSKFDAKLDALRSEVNARFDAVNSRLDAIDQRFDDMRDLWRAELHRVEEVIDARLKHLEGRI